MNWDNFKFFLAIARNGSARAASSSTNMSHSTITRRIDQLETKLGTKLFNRLASGYQLTESGREVFQIATRMEADVHDIERRLIGKESQLFGTIRLTVPKHVLTPNFLGYIKEFSDKYHEIDIDLMPSYENFDLHRREADVAIRVIRRANQPPQTLVGYKLVDIYSSNYCSLDYYEAHDLNNPNDACWIGWGNEDRSPEWVANSAFPNLPTRHFFNEPYLQLQAAKAGLGIAMLPCFMCDTEATLVRVPNNHCWPNYDIWMLYHPDLRDTKRLRVFRQFLRDRFTSDANYWEGQLPQAAQNTA